ncbi:helix-turn-helix domain-containing protein [Sphingopyxis flava]|uniref:Transcriptional regulator, XRE family n=1 Tax=Sphingopyxis flava TaxID=1507287 RepID=A0A1T5C9A7_9SPHN|nr:helix-turn-helix transcriptional regulator [Sphingopyxis flava]SKB55946.1 transcriptional regulator, XRE family [Sphingopyxis flava]
MHPTRLYAGRQLRDLRAARAIRQADFAAQLGISASYLSQIEHDDRPLTPGLLDRLQRLFPLEWEEIAAEAGDRRAAALREAAADPLFAAAPMAPEQLERAALQQPQLADQFVALHAAYRRAGQRLQIIDEALTGGTAEGSRLPWEEVRDWFHDAGNYVDSIDRAAETLATGLRGAPSPPIEAIERQLRDALGISIVYQQTQSLRDFDATMRHLVIDPSQPAESRRFQLAHQLAALALAGEIAAVVEASPLRTAAARQLLHVGLANYAAGAVLMPYTPFRSSARAVRHDIDRLRLEYGVSFEQACHRLSTLQRPGARGIPMFFCRVDMAGNITKRHSATRLQFARFGGACPLWIVHEAAAIPDRILFQLAETPDGLRYVSMAKGLVKPSGSYARSPRRYAVALGCEAQYAAEFVYADGVDVDAPHAAARIGPSCRICPRDDCDQRAFPPSDRPILVDPDRRDVVPYRIG